MVGTGPTSDREAAHNPGSERPSEGPDPTLLKIPSKLPPIPQHPLIGQVVANRYRIEELIGQGGMGHVYRAVHIHMQKNVAIKILRHEMTVFPEMVARFEREAVAAGRISHPNVAAATDFGRIGQDGAFYLALEYVAGQSLRRELKRGPFSLQRTMNVTLQICEALVAAHLQGVVHRDLKPDNILLLEDPTGERVKVLDFGIAKFNDATTAGDEHLTRLGVVMGTPQYMSPEQARGETVDPRSDLYSLGVIVYEMLSGRVPFVARSVTAAVSQHLVAEPPALPESVPPDLAQVCLSLFATEVDERPASAAEALQALRAIRKGYAPVPPLAERAAPGPVERSRAAAALLLRRVSPHVHDWASGMRFHAKARWRAATSRWPALAVLERRVLIGRRSVPIGTLLAAIGALACLIVVWPRSGPPNRESVATDVNPVPLATPISGVPGNAAAISREELDDLLAIPVYKRDQQQWLAIAEGHAQHQAWKRSASAYRNALQLTPALKTDPELLQHLRDLALHPEAHEAVVNVAVNLLGEPGIDLLYDVWQQTRGDDSKRTIATNAQKNLAIFRLRSASPALRVPLALQFTNPDECEDISKVLTDALEHADARAVPQLERLREKTGCGLSKKRDCYPCLRPRAAELDTAIRLAKSRSAPHFDGKRYIPGQGG